MPSDRNESVKITDDRYKWVALSNTTMGALIAAIDASIVIISMPAIFRGIGLDPLSAGNITYLLWMILGYLLVTAVLVVSLGRLGDMFGRVRMYNLGFLVFTIASVALSLDPYSGHSGALWLILWRVVQAVGGAMLTANSAAILTDAFPLNQRGMALGINQISSLAGTFIGLLLGGVLAEWDWRAVFWVNVPIGVIGTIWSYRSLRDNGIRRKARVDWGGNITFTLGAGLILAAITHGIQPYGGHATGWTNPLVIGGLVGGALLLVFFVLFEQHTAEPMFRLALFRIRAFSAGAAATLAVSIARGGMQFMLIIWLQGIWLPLHGYRFEDTPLWAGIYLIPLTVGFLVAGPVSGTLSDRYGSKTFATVGAAVASLSFVGLLLLPVNFHYWEFALLLLLSGLGQGVFSAPNTSAMMSAVPDGDRGAASGMRSTFVNSGSALSIGIFFSLMTAGLASSLPTSLTSGLTAQGVSPATAHSVATLPPVSTLFAAFLGNNPIQHLLQPTGALQTLPASHVATLTGKSFFPQVISAPFHHGLGIVFGASAILCALAALASLLRGKNNRRVAPVPVAEPALASTGV